RFFEVPYELAGKTVHLVVDPHTRTVVGVEDKDGVALGAATPLDKLANRHRRRRKPRDPQAQPASPSASVARSGPTLIDTAYLEHYRPIAEDPTSEEK
ncbi:Integrase catalytic region, partial [mine drainage metagenome]